MTSVVEEAGADRGQHIISDGTCSRERHPITLKREPCRDRRAALQGTSRWRLPDRMTAAGGSSKGAVWQGLCGWGSRGFCWSADGKEERLL